MEYYNVSGISIAVIENGQISKSGCKGLLEAGTNKNVKSSSVFNACSISKFLTSILINGQSKGTFINWGPLS
ncbi:serine hydrolase [Peribacillus simplex]|uniref:serine hydrolase n=1 Tax=Peribacillus simplex TaxID=1478 RepID=UPI003D298B1B